jgi:hypothetical protein
MVTDVHFAQMRHTSQICSPVISLVIRGEIANLVNFRALIYLDSQGPSRHAYSMHRVINDVCSLAKKKLGRAGNI